MDHSVESKLDVLALGYDHYRILRDSAARAEEYVNRIQKRGGEVLEEEFWIELPEPTLTIGLKDVSTALLSLVGEMALKMGEIKEQAAQIVEELKLTESVDSILYNLAEAQRKEKKKKILKAQEIEGLKRESKETPLLNSLANLPALGPNQQYEYVGMQEGESTTATAIWKIIDTPLKSNKEKTLVKSTFHLRQRPKT